MELYSDFTAWETPECQTVQARNGTTNPVSLAIDADDLYRFQRYLIQQREQSNRNVNKYVGNIQAIHATPIHWRNISFETASPAIGSHATSPHGWVWYVPEKQKRSKPDPLVLPLPTIARKHLLRSGKSEPGEPVFNWPISPRSFYATWGSIVAAVGLNGKTDLKSGQALQLDIKHLRKTSVTWHNYHTEGIAPLITGHADRDTNKVTSRHYGKADFA